MAAYRELREKEEIEKYRMERPKIQQQFSDLKVHFFNNYICIVFIHYKKKLLTLYLYNHQT